MIRIADLAGTFVFAVGGALAALNAHFDPVGTLVLAFLTALGGGLIRDLLIGAMPPAAVADWVYAAVVIIAAAATWALFSAAFAVPAMLLTTLDAAGLALFVVVGTEKALDYGIHPLPSIFLGAVSGVGGGVMRDVMLNTVPRVLYVDIYATAAILAAAIVVIGRTAKLPRRAIAALALAACFTLRIAAVTAGWQLPRAG